MIRKNLTSCSIAVASLFLCVVLLSRDVAYPQDLAMGSGRILVTPLAPIHIALPLKNEGFLNETDYTITDMDRVSDDRYIVSLQGFNRNYGERPRSAADQPGQAGTFTIIALINRSGKVLFTSQDLIPGGSIFFDHKVHLFTLDAMGDSSCAFFFTPDESTGYCFDSTLNKMDRFSLPAHTFDLASGRDASGQPFLLVLAPSGKGLLHRFDPVKKTVTASFLPPEDVESSWRSFTASLPKRERSSIEDFDFRKSSPDSESLPGAMPFHTLVRHEGYTYLIALRPPVVLQVAPDGALRFFFYDLDPSRLLHPTKEQLEKGFGYEPKIVRAFDVTPSSKSKTRTLLALLWNQQDIRLGDLQTRDPDGYRALKYLYPRWPDSKVFISKEPTLVEIRLPSGKTTIRTDLHWFRDDRYIYTEMIFYADGLRMAGSAVVSRLSDTREIVHRRIELLLPH